MRVVSALGCAVVSMLLLAGASMVAQARPQDVELQAAIRTETVANDLKGAVRQFKDILARYPADRAVTATALVHLADCYRRLGDAESQKVYLRIVNEFGDRPEAAVARARLAPAEADAPAPRRRVWTAPEDGDLASPVSYDGRYVAYVDWSDAGKGDLFVHAFSGGIDRRVTATNNVKNTTWKRFADQAAFSRDGRQVAYSWTDLETGRNQLRIAGLTGIADAQPRVLVDVEAPAFIAPYDWTRDGQWIAAIWRENGKDSPRRIGLVSTKDGTRRELTSIDRPCACNLDLSLSPDGRYLAFDLPGTDTKQRDVFVLDTASGRERIPTVVYQGNDELVGWAPDGKSIVFTSDRRGALGLWTVPFVDGRPGTQTLLRADLGVFGQNGIAATGAIYFCSCEAQGGSDVKIASFDFSTGRFTSPPADAVQDVGTNFQPFWSPDGMSFVYRSQRPNQDPMLVIQDAASGDVHELRPRLAGFQSPRWAPDGRSMAVMGRDFQNRFGWYRVDAQTGRSSPIIIYPPGSSLWEIAPDSSWSPDGRTLFFRRQVRGVEFLFADVDAESSQEHVHLRLPGQDTLPAALSSDQRTLYYQRPASGGAAPGEIALIARDLASGNEREILRRPGMGMRNDMIRLSPDGRSIAMVVDGSTGHPAAVLVAPIAGGQAREVFRTDAAQALSVSIWAPDGGSLMVRTPASQEKPSDFWWVPLDGRPARALSEFASLRPTGLFLHPDGKRILFGAKPATTEPTRPVEFWVLENAIKK